MSNYSTFEDFTVSGTMGRKEPELRYLANSDGSATAILNLSICADRPVGRDTDQHVVLEPQWYKVVMYGRQAEAVAQKAFPGCAVMVKDAYLRVRFWRDKAKDNQLILDNAGLPRYDLELIRGRVMVMDSKARPAVDTEGWTTEQAAD